MKKGKEVKTTIDNKKRTMILFGIFLVALIFLAFRVGWHQIVKGDEYKRTAQEQQKKDQSIEAERGVIKDRNGKELAISTVSYSVWISKNDMSNTDIRKKNYEENIGKIAEILGVTKKELKDKINGSKGQVKVAKYLNRNIADTIKMTGIPGVYITDETKRYYPLGNFASDLLGSVTDDNNGLSGIELEYNKVLSGTAGRWVKNTDEKGTTLATGTEKYYEPIDGATVELTIDQAIQYYAENAVNEAYAKTKSQETSAIVMNVKTGEILAAASTPSFDPNNPRVPLDPKEKKAFDALGEGEKTTYLSKMWRSPLFNDTYEPGSTAKLMTASMALEEGIATPDSTYYCNGYINVADAKIKCWIYPGAHGKQTLTEAVSNSCNPVHLTLASQIGIKKFYDYLDLFGITEYTGIDYPGEGTSLLQNIDTAGPVGIATMGFGQGIAVTPIQLITAVSSLGNGGKLMQPTLAKEIVDSDGKTLKKFEPKVVRKTVSEKTASQMKDIMLKVVDSGSGSAAQISGYEVGGKTATAQMVVNGKYGDKYTTSFIAMAPMKDPEIAVLFINKAPANQAALSTETAVVWEKQIMENTLRYLKIKPTRAIDESKNQKKTKVAVPNVTEESLSTAVGVFDGLELIYKVSPKGADKSDFTIKDQYPKPGVSVNKGSTVYLYKE